MNLLKKIWSPIAWLFGKAWWLLDGSRRVVLNLLWLLILIIAVTALFRGGPKPLQDKTTLVLSLRGPLVEQFSGSARSQAVAELQGQKAKRQTRLRDVLAALDSAAKDARISAVLLDLDEFSGAGMAGLHELSGAIQRFRAESKKPVYAYGDHYSQRAYYLAAQASEVYMHPMGTVQVEGFGGYRLYYKDALDRLGISANVLRVGSYKNAAEPYFTNAPSKATQEADAALYGELWTSYTDGVEAARKLDKGTISRDIETLPQQLAALKGDTCKLALQQKLIDGIRTRDEMRALLIEKGAKDGTSFRRIGYAEYLGQLKPQLPYGPALGVVVAEGSIVDGEAQAGRIGGDSTAQLIRRAREDEQVKALVLRVNSPGGSAFASEVVRRELELTRKAGKPVVISMGDVAASGGYWISMSSDRVIADAGTITGSIGVYGMLPTAEKLMDKLSLHSGGTTTTWLARSYDPSRALDPRFASIVQSSIDHVYDEFTTRAAAARKKKVAEIDAVAQGRVWTGRQALERGLVDQLGSFGDALKAAAELAKLQVQPRLIYVEREPGRLDRLLASLADASAPAIQAAFGDMPQMPVLPEPLQQAWQDLSWLSQVSDSRRPYTAVVHCLCAAP
ncbi:signal peptide peptidase SppA [Pelomonas sp. SE-A7]|uniref:signal peptide peptidase SppA n=1 Tax=Pelomonas sp. SE-A7 TaxID=3054953 RepID=UPI00259D2D49|nr:signal peptide peptidase SppA [Pelomonas sp. SE-A7]MDM4766929.1 signal peptide peptidase SppA [Pelomonas sp. SE-A7]